MASAYSMSEIREKLMKRESTKKSDKAWTYVTTKDQKCSKCKFLMHDGTKVAVSYDGVMAEFSHADGCPPLRNPLNKLADHIQGGSRL